MRKSLEKCDVDADIDLFVREKATGSARPITIPYINFYHPTDHLAGMPSMWAWQEDGWGTISGCGLGLHVNFCIKLCCTVIAEVYLTLHGIGQWLDMNMVPDTSVPTPERWILTECQSLLIFMM